MEGGGVTEYWEREEGRRESVEGGGVREYWERKEGQKKMGRGGEGEEGRKRGGGERRNKNRVGRSREVCEQQSVHYSGHPHTTLESIRARGTGHSPHPGSMVDPGTHQTLAG